MVNNELIDYFIEFFRLAKLDMFCKSEENREIIAFAYGRRCIVPMEIGIYDVTGNPGYPGHGETGLYWGYIREVNKFAPYAPEYETTGSYRVQCNAECTATNIADLLHRLADDYITDIKLRYEDFNDYGGGINCNFKLEQFRNNAEIIESTGNLE